MIRFGAFVLAALLAGCATPSRYVSDLDRLVPSTRGELNRALYGQTVDLIWDAGDVSVSARAVVVGADSVRFVPQRSDEVRARPVTALVRIDALARRRGGGAGPLLGGVAAAVVASRVWGSGGETGPFRIGLILGAFSAGAVLVDKLVGAQPRTARVVLYERRQMSPGADREGPAPAPR